MSRKRRSRRRKPRLSATQLYSGIKALLYQSHVQLQRGNYDRALAQAETALQRNPTPAERETALRLEAEAHLRSALETENSHLRLQQIDNALALMPDDPRLRLYRGWTLWETERYAEALAEFDAVASQKPEWPGIFYLRQLGRLATGRPWGADELSESETNTLRLVQNLIQPGSSAQARQLLGEPLLGEPLWDDMPHLWQMLVETKHGVASLPARPPEPDHPTRDNTVAAIQRYYEGVAAMQTGDNDAAHAAWLAARAAGLDTPWLIANLAALQRKQATDWAKQKQWQAIVENARETPELVEQDRILAETVALAHTHLGYENAQNERWEEATKHWRQAMRHAPNRQTAQNLALAAEAQEEWEQAAQAWREMVRRRPRKPSHPDYLDDSQVAELWRHVATCYQNDDEIEEAITCLKHASNYAGDNTEIRLALVEALMANEQWEAAGNELDRILAIDPDNIEALKQQALLLTIGEGWYRDTVAHWKRILELEPDNVEAKDALAQAYIERHQHRWFAPENSIAYYEQALADLPDHPALLVALARVYERIEGEEEKAVATLLRAHRAAPTDSHIADLVLHRLLHLEDEGVENIEPAVQELILDIRNIEVLLPAFWLSQIESLLVCELGNHWIEYFIREALDLAERPYVRDTRASLLAKACELLITLHEPALAATYLDVIRAQVPESGAVQYVQALLAADDGATSKGRRLLKTGRRLARRAHESELLELIEYMLTKFDMGLASIPDSVLMRLMELFPDAPPSPAILEAFFE